jgi:hypothetical protein
MRLKTVFLTALFFVLAKHSTLAQINGRIATLTVKASATVTDNLQMLTIRNIDLVNPGINGNQITVSPITSSFSGMFKITGNPRGKVRVTYLQNEVLKEQSEGIGTVKVRFEISGAPQDTQFQSTLLTVGEANISLSEKGEFFIWLGGVLDVSLATPGIYLSEFLIELEYT